MNRVLTAILIIFVELSNAQTIKQYSGQFGAGSGQYSYYEDQRGERIKHGKFFYVENSVQGIGTYSEKLNFSVSGNFKNGLHDGDWTEKYIQLRGGWTGALTHYDPVGRRYVLDGYTINNNKDIAVESIVKCHFSNGKLSGNYSSETFKMKDNKPVLEKSVKAQFYNGHLIGKYIMKNGSEKLSGQFDSLGFVDGKWVLLNYRERKIMEFEHGCLKSQIVKSSPESELISVYNNFRINIISELRQSNCLIDSEILINDPNYIRPNEESEESETENDKKAKTDYTIGCFTTDPNSEWSLNIPIFELNKTDFFKVYNVYNTKKIYLTIFEEEVSGLNEYINNLISERNRNRAIDSNDIYSSALVRIEQAKKINERAINDYNSKLYKSEYYPEADHSKSYRQLLKDSIESFKAKNEKLDSFELTIDSWRKQYVKKINIENNYLYKHPKELVLSEIPIAKYWEYKDSLNIYSLALNKVTSNDLQEFNLEGSITYDNNVPLKFQKTVNYNEFINEEFDLISGEDFDVKTENHEIRLNVNKKIILSKFKAGKFENDVILVSK